MKSEIESLVGVIRVWQDDKGYGDPYEWVATVRWRTRTEVEIMGYTKPVTPSIWKSVVRECQRKGITKILAVTYVDRKRKERWINVPSPFERLYK